MPLVYLRLRTTRTCAFRSVAPLPAFFPHLPLMTARCACRFAFSDVTLAHEPPPFIFVAPFRASFCRYRAPSRAIVAACVCLLALRIRIIALRGRARFSSGAGAACAISCFPARALRFNIAYCTPAHRRAFIASHLVCHTAMHCWILRVCAIPRLRASPAFSSLYCLLLASGRSLIAAFLSFLPRMPHRLPTFPRLRMISR